MSLIFYRRYILLYPIKIYTKYFTLPLIHYSDLSHLRSILAWIRPEITNKVKDDSKKYAVKELLKIIVAYLENYISPERNESFHSRLQLYETEKLNNFLVDTRRILEEINKLKNLIEK